MNKPIGIFLIGGPGSGKDYVLKNIFSRFDLTEVQTDQILNGAAAELFESNKNIVINGANDANKIKLVQNLLEGYTFDFVHVSVTNKVSRLRNEQREQPITESKRIDKYLKAEQLAKDVEAFIFNNSINLNESSEMEKVFFGSQIEKLLERVLELGLQIKETPESKSFAVIKEKYFPPVAKDKASGLPKKYVRGLSASTAKARKAHWKEKSKLSDSDPRAYEPAPGDATAKTKPSKHTLAVRKMMDEAEQQKVRRIARSGNIAAVMDKRKETGRVDEGASDSSIAAKAKKSGISVGTLRKVYNRGVAAWNSGHRPGTTPQQWGHARVNSYINKGKTYHTADKDLREEAEQIDELDQKTLKSYINKSIKTGRADDSKGAHNLYRATSKVARNQATSTLKKKVSNLRYTPIAKHKNPFEYEASREELGNRKVSEEVDINELFEMQLVGTDEYRKHAIAMTPGQSQEIEDAFPVKSPNKKPIAVPAKPGKSIVSQYTAEESDCDCGGDCGCSENESVREGSERNLRSFRDLRGGVTEAKKEEQKEVDTTPTLGTKKKKGPLAAPRNLDSTMQGLPVASRFSAYEETEVESSLTLEEAVEYHLENKISFTENVFRPASEMFFEMIKEAKRLYSEGKYVPKDEWEKDMLNSDIGETAEFEGQTVVLDYPIEEGLEECWTGYTQKGMKKKGNKMVPNCVPVNEANDPTNGKGIGKPWQEGGGGAVYVRVGDGVRKVSFSKSGMKKKYMDPAATRSFVARHRCLTNKDKTSASYWACRWPRFFSNSGKTWW